MVLTWLHIAIIMFFIAGGAVAGGPLLAAWLLSPKVKGGDIGMTYECGIRPFGDAWVRFGVNYYIYALLFLAFEVDVLYLFPVASFYPQEPGLVGFFKVFVFLFVIVMAVVFFWAKGVFSWPRRIK